MSIENPQSLPLEARAEMLLLSLSVPPHLKGFRYLVHAILLSIEDESRLGNIMTGLYDRIAADYSVTGFSVERNARTALRQVPPELCHEILHAPASRGDKAISVRHFVSLCVVKLKYAL